MDLKKMFATQAELDARIEREHPPTETENRLMDTCLALLVELGECANEQRTWKYWSHDREPRNEALVKCAVCEGSGKSLGGYCGSCHGGYVGVANPLLDEYADVLHFTLSIGNSVGFGQSVTLPHRLTDFVSPFPVNWGAADSIGYVFRTTASFMEKVMLHESKLTLYYIDLIRAVLSLAIFLGFDWTDVEKAYYAKNAINHNRQESGY